MALELTNASSSCSTTFQGTGSYKRTLMGLHQASLSFLSWSSLGKPSELQICNVILKALNSEETNCCATHLSPFITRQGLLVLPLHRRSSVILESFSVKLANFPQSTVVSVIHSRMARSSVCEPILAHIPNIPITLTMTRLLCG